MGGQPTDWYRLGLLTYEQVQAWIVNLRTGTGLDCVKNSATSISCLGAAPLSKFSKVNQRVLILNKIILLLLSLSKTHQCWLITLNSKTDETDSLRWCDLRVMN
jgi:hypothetical protein